MLTIVIDLLIAVGVIAAVIMLAGQKKILKEQHEELQQLRETVEKLGQDVSIEQDDQDQESETDSLFAALAGAAEVIEEEQDAKSPENGPEASAYNTGKSGKIYTKEELELLIKE